MSEREMLTPCQHISYILNFLTMKFYAKLSRHV